MTSAFANRLLGMQVSLRRRTLSTLQINLGKRCNQACRHCHVDASPTRTEQMSPEVVADVVAALDRLSPRTLDITGGAPELHPQFRTLVVEAVARGVHVIDRCNLTILTEPGQEDLAQFLADHRVEVIASLPCYLEDNVDQQRGPGIFSRSLDGLRQLNALGYARGPRTLNLVYNPVGTHLPPDQTALEADYKRVLAERYGIVFDKLYAITNMPIARFATHLKRQGELGAYQQRLLDAFNPAALQGLMCLDQVSVDWRGNLYDCDFNQMLDMGLGATIGDVQPQQLLSRDIEVEDHCFGCTAGAGSSCGGALTD